MFEIPEDLEHGFDRIKMCESNQPNSSVIAYNYLGNGFVVFFNDSIYIWLCFYTNKIVFVL